MDTNGLRSTSKRAQSWEVMTRRPIYLDFNATTPIAPEVADAMRPALEGLFGNPSSSHDYGAEAHLAIEGARRQLATLVGSHPDELIFTSGGTESNNLAIIGTARAHRSRGRHIITSAIEHPAVTEVCTWLQSEGWSVTELPVDSTGLVDPAAVERALTTETTLVTVMHANNEVGTIEPIAEIARIAHRGGALMHTDAAQSLGKIPVEVDELGVDLLSIAGHKLYAPKGVGALYLRRGTEIARLMHGADHERGLRPGTENVLEVIGLGAAAELAGRELERRAEQLSATRDRLHRAVIAGIDDARLNGHPDRRLPNTLSLSIPGLAANELLDELPGVAASAGAACHSGGIALSRVLTAMGVEEQVAMGTLRFSTGRATTVGEVDRAAEQVLEVVARLRGR